MTVARTVNLSDLTPQELAELFCDMNNDQQADFFNAVGQIANAWSGSGWCQQACDIVRSRALSDDGRKAIAKLAEHWALQQEDVSQ